MDRLLIFFVLSSVALAGTTEDGIPDSRYRAYGQSFKAYTCQLSGWNVAGGLQVGTCTLIAPDWALTAAHVVHNLTSASVVTDAGRHRVDRIFIHREWADVYAEHDIALVHVAKPFELKRYPALTDGSEQLGSVVAAAGYGVTGRLSQGYERGDFEIRAGTMRLTGMERSVYVCQIRRAGSPLPYCIAPGDSGGPLWGTAADGRTVVIGVNSYTAKAGQAPVRSRVGEESGHTRVSLYQDWIAEVTGGVGL
jgi:secreted trypsin-like serine protease